jgi:uncharacterized membrane protein
MELTDVLLFVHIVAAMAWLGGGFLAGVFASRMKAADPQHALGFARTMRMVSMKVFMPATLIVFAAGTWLVSLNEVYGYEQLWVSIGFGVVLIAGAMGPLFFKPTIEKGIAAMEAGDGPTAGALMRRLGIGSKAVLLLEFVAVWAMIVKPGL